MPQDGLCTGIPAEVINEAIYRNVLLEELETREYEIEFEDLRKLDTPLYKIQKREDRGTWRMEWYEDSNKERKPLGSGHFSIVREKAKEIWTKHRDGCLDEPVIDSMDYEAVCADIPDEVIDRLVRDALASKFKGSTQYQFDYDDFLPVANPYHVNKRRDSKSGIYYLCYWDKRDYRISTGTTNYQKAKKIAAELWDEKCGKDFLVG